MEQGLLISFLSLAPMLLPPAEHSEEQYTDHNRLIHLGSAVGLVVGDGWRGC